MTAKTQLDDIPDAIKPWVRALGQCPNRVERLVSMARLMQQRQRPDWAVPLIRLAQSAAGRDPAGQVALRRYWNLPAWHCSILNDQHRAQGYEAALREVIRPDDLVLEIGAGSGILALLAARAGARRVITCETNPYLADAAREIIAANGYADRITVLHKSSKDLAVGEDLPRPVDVLLGDHFTGNLYPGGGLALYRDALQRLTAPGARTLPRRGGRRVALVSCPGLAERYRPGSVAGFDVSAFARFMPAEFAVPDAEWRQFDPPLLLSSPQTPFVIEFGQLARLEESHQSLTLTATRSGRVDGLVSWTWLELTPTNAWDGGCGAGTRRWPRFLHVFPRPLEIAEGEALEFQAVNSEEDLLLTPGTRVRDGLPAGSGMDA